MLRTDTINTKADDELREQVQNSGNNEVVTETEETTTTPSKVVTPTVGTSEPFFNRQQQVALTLMPLASALLQGKTQGGQSQLSGLLAAAGQGLAGSTNVALQLAQLEKDRTKTSTTLKQYKLQPGVGKVQIGDKVYTPEMNRILNLSADVVNQFPSDTFMEVTTDKKSSFKTEKFDLTYVGTEAEAKKLFPNNPEIQKLIVTTDANQIGQPVMRNNQRLIADVIFRDGIQESSRIGLASKQPTGMRDVTKGSVFYQENTEKAKEYLKERGITEEMEGFDYIVRKITNKELAGKQMFEGGVAMVLEGEGPDVAGAALTSVTLVPNKDIKDPNFKPRQKYLEKLDKSLEAMQTQYDQIAPRIDTVLNILASGTKTGIKEEFLLPIRRWLVGFTGADAKQVRELSAQELIASSSDALAPLMRVAGSGSTSDMEFKAYRNAAVSLANVPKANYISLYMLRKIKENALNAQLLRSDLATDVNLSKGAIKRAVDAQDKGIFIKYDGDIDDDVAIKNWFNSTKRGDVILNLDSMGRPLLTDSSGASLGQFVVSDGQGGALFQ
mgnify:CR=1 FL=1